MALEQMGSKHSTTGQAYDCPPTLTDRQVLDFCHQGYLKLEAVVPDEINRRTTEYIESKTKASEPNDILYEDWFDEHVTKNKEAAGAVRSLLGKDFLTPQLMAKHRVQCPMEAQEWHRDGGSIYTRRLDYLQVFYYPQDTPPEMGPTEVVPGTHFSRQKANYMAHYGKIRTAVSTASPAGSIFLTIYSIWHRRARSTATGVRNMLKYNYWRTAEPRRDWIVDPDFDCSWPAHDPIPMFEQFKRAIAAVEMFSWLCGDEFDHVGGQCWPCECSTGPDCDQHGVPRGLRRYPEGVTPSIITY